MQVIIKPKKEPEVLAAVKDEATPAEVRQAMVERAECCVDHLCGCR